MQVFLLLAVLTIVADGTVFTAQCDTRANCTAVLQQALNRGGGVVDTVIVPYNNNSEPYQTAPLFIQRNNFKLVLEPGVVLEAMAGSFKGTNDCLITAEMVANVSVVAAGAVLRMRYANLNLQRYQCWCKHTCTETHVRIISLLHSIG